MEPTIELISASVSDRGLSEKRPVNEDSFAELPQYGVFAVADGVGGAQAGDFASQMAMEILTEAVTHRSGDTDSEKLFRMAIEQANRSIHSMAADVPQLSSMATTIVALHLKENIATLAHVGDSRIYRFSPDGNVFRETNDHSVVEEEVRAGRMTPEEAAIHPSRNVISRAVGAEENVEIDIKMIMVEPNTTFLLCSDGITRHISDEELQAIFGSGAQPQLICNHLREICYSRGAEDNLTAVIVRTAGKYDELDSTISVDDEETIATARTAAAVFAAEEFDIDDGESLLELEPEPMNESDGREEQGHSNGEFQEPEPIAEQQPEIAEVAPTEVPISEDTDEQFLLTEPDDEPAVVEDLSGYTSKSVVVPAQTPKQVPEQQFSMFGSDGATKEVAAESSRNGKGRILISLGLLALGAIIAIGATYLLGFIGQTEEVAPPPPIEAKSENIPMTEYEESRRLVDKDPAGYVRNNTATPRDAVDFYLLGRALLLSGNTAEAKRQFELAKERLPEIDEAARQTLANDIAMGIAITESPQAIEAFKKATNPNAEGTNSVALPANR